MTGYQSKRAAAQDKLDNDDLTIAYQSGYYDGKKAAQPAQIVPSVYSNTHQPTQEPVTWAGVDFDINTTPPQCPWVGLTDEAFNTWWNTKPSFSETNPCMTDSFEYWAWEGWHAALAQLALERNFCPRCGNRTWEIHTCTAPQENT